MDPSGLSIYNAGPNKAPESDLYRFMTRRGLSEPDSIALSSLRQPASHLSNVLGREPHAASLDHLEWTYGELDAAAANLACWIETRAGTMRGQAVLAALGNSAEWCLVFWAAVRLGAVFVPLNPAVLRRQDEVVAMLELIPAKVAVVAGADDAAAFSRTGRSLPVLLVKGGADEEVPDGWQALSDVTVDSNATAMTNEPCGPDDLAYIHFTSGSTGLPKACPKTGRIVQAEINGYHAMNALDWLAPGARYLQTTKPHGVVNYLASVSAWAGGGEVVVHGTGFDAESVVRALVRERITHLWLFPTALVALIESPCLAEYLHSGLRIIIVSGDSIAKDTLDRASQKLGALHLLSWGMSEGAPLFGWETDEKVPVLLDGQPSVGRPLPGTSARIAKSDTNEPLPIMATGELQVQSTAFVTAYLGGRSPETFMTTPTGQWAKTGDVACMDDSGAVYIRGREKDLIKTSGHSFVPSVVQSWMRRTYGVEACVFGVPDRVRGEVPVAVVEMPGLRDEQRDEMSGKVHDEYGEPYYLARVFELADLGLSSWPHGATGKVSKGDLKDMVCKKLGV